MLGFKIAFGICSFFLFFGVARAASAATLYVSPTSGTHAVGESFNVGVYVSSADQAMNAASGTLQFPTGQLEVTGVSTGGSIMNLWVAQPSFSNANGTVNFEGIVFNPGYTGSAGNIITISFKAKAEGSAAVSFGAGKVLANDGLGTDITKGLGSATYTITGASATPAPTPTPTPEPKPTGAVLGAPTVVSSTHPDPETWYAGNDVTFSWTLPSGTTGVNILADQDPDTNPGTKSDGMISSYTFEDVKEGQWYFHIRFQNAAGWGAVSHVGFRVDTAPPTDLVVTLIGDKVSANANDATSGVTEYRVSVDGGDEVLLADMETLKPGTHSVRVTAVDAAGNTMTATESLTVAVPEPVPAPQIIEQLPNPQTNVGAVVALLLVLAIVLVLFVRLLIKLAEGVSTKGNMLHVLEAMRRDIRLARPLTRDEALLVKKIRKDIEDAEKKLK